MLILLFPLCTFCHLHRYLFTSCLSIGQNCCVVAFEASQYQLTNTVDIDLILRGILLEYLIKFVLSGPIFIPAAETLLTDDYILLRFDMCASTIPADHLALEKRANSDGHFDPCFVGFRL